MTGEKSETPQFRHAQEKPDDGDRAARFMDIEKAAAAPMSDPKQRRMVAGRPSPDAEGRVKPYLDIERRGG